MPEGPEVRLNSDALRTLLADHRLTKINLLSGKLSRNGFKGLQDFKPGVVKRVNVKGKAIIISLDHGGELVSTLGMSGWWYPSREEARRYYDEASKAYQSGKLVSALATVEQALKYSRASLDSDDKALAVFSDMRNFGNLEYFSQGATPHLQARIGIDLLNELPGWEPERCQQSLLQAKRRATKRQLNMKMGDLSLEQELIAGLGNIYRAETFWLTGIDPYVKFGELSEDDWLRFCEVSSCVLQIAYGTHGVMSYSASFLESCGHAAAAFTGHLAYARSQDIYGRKIVRDDSFNRPLWRVA